MEANGGDHAPANGGDHAPVNGGGGHAPANGGGGHALANRGGNHALANGGGGHALYLAFLCLLAQEIALSRWVYRLWHDITGTEAFRLDHHHHHRCQRPMPLLVIPDHGLTRCSIHAADTRDLVVRPVIHYPLGHGSMPIHGCCGGILLLSFGRRLYACNPCTRRWASLPPVHIDDCIVSFYENDDGFFHVLYRDREEPDCMYGIFRLEANPIFFKG
jgi:hypothetical protein